MIIFLNQNVSGESMVISIKRDFKTIVLYDSVNSSSLKFIIFRLNGTEMFLIFGQNWGSGWLVMWEGSGGVPLYNYMFYHLKSVDILGLS